jgi:hypothetical protein
LREHQVRGGEEAGRVSWVDGLTKVLNSLASVLTAFGTFFGAVAAAGAMIALRRTGSVRPDKQGGKHRRTKTSDPPAEEDDHEHA